MTNPLESVNLNATEIKSDGEAGWPLSYRLQIPQCQNLGDPPPKQWWSHRLYRGPENKAVEVLYSKTKEDSEALALKFLDEPMVGFDMEWPIFPKTDRLQEKIGLIQVACEDKIALFHIGLHVGETTEELIAPSLQKIIESSSIAKTGVAINKADFGRLSKYFGLKPKAAFELSHLHRLVTFGASRPELVTAKFVKLSEQVEDHLGLPLSKGEVRTSNWSRPLSQEQIDYAAADAYAGFMLFHCMNAKRKTMEPAPPLPIMADEYLRSGKNTTLQLQPLEEGGSITTIAGFFGLNKDISKALEGQGVVEAAAAEIKASTKAKAKAKEIQGPKKDHEPLDSFSQALYKSLSLRRKALADSIALPAYRVASNAVLEGLARERPLNEDALLQVKGVGKWQQETYGAEWLQVITLFLAENKVEACQAVVEVSLAAAVPDGDVCATVVGLDARTSTASATPTQRRRIAAVTQLEGSYSSSAACGNPPIRTPVLHTGLSFNLEDTRLDSEEGVEMDQGRASDSAAAAAAAATTTYATAPSRSTSQLKRKRSSTAVGEDVSLELVIFRNKLLAFSRQVTSKLNPRPVTALVTEGTLDQIVSAVPQTKEELDRIPGIGRLVDACEGIGRDLLAQIHKYAPGT
ncbi:hypothetical protein K505DRAFT_320477 [Melanomma pulvis-pyrius CBS 109.77]|uniref:HRDC domain-containing protein n=1 Tax=Melanomma pulvis-pyrius CBS 109.77 TaxID=1314802 RepID=A0A6A6XVU5_9PLEO|nr:hypothetical protein K505DRAFT_320477 [Melanomma pulvis-pyrius CBS 109.77]